MFRKCHFLLGYPYELYSWLAWPVNYCSFLGQETSPSMMVGVGRAAMPVLGLGRGSPLPRSSSPLEGVQAGYLTSEAPISDTGKPQSLKITQGRRASKTLNTFIHR